MKTDTHRIVTLIGSVEQLQPALFQAVQNEWFELFFPLFGLIK